jgi:nitrogen-specific signal transduction histidine kinase
MSHPAENVKPSLPTNEDLHRLRNLLTGIGGFSQLLSLQLKDRPRDHELAQRIQRATDEVARMVGRWQA